MNLVPDPLDFVTGDCPYCRKLEAVYSIECKQCGAEHKICIPCRVVMVHFYGWVFMVPMCPEVWRTLESLPMIET